jgi:hypothetical protein
MSIDMQHMKTDRQTCLLYACIAISLLVLSFPSDVLAACAGFGATPTCTGGQVLDPDTCSCTDPAPEMSVMMLPIALGAAGLLAVRSRRKAMKKKNTPNTPST